MASALGVAAGMLAFGPAPAQAATVPPNTMVVAAGGSDTTDNVMGPIIAAGTPANNGASAKVRWVHIPAFPGPSGTKFNVPGDTYLNDCPETNWVVPPTAPDGAATPQELALPQGSGNGRTALNNSAGGAVGNNGCLDIARSSSFGTNAAGTFRSFAFALDTQSWASPSLQAPGTMRKSDLKKIWQCQITDWSQLPGGGKGPIVRIQPNTGSGTWQFFLSDLLDGQAPAPDSPSCPMRTTDRNGNLIEENAADTIRDEDWQKAILPYSGGQWVFQANNSLNPTLDRRKALIGGYTTKLGGLIDDLSPGAASCPTGPVTSCTFGSPVGYAIIDQQWQLNDTGLFNANNPVDSSFTLGPVVESNSKKVSPTTYAYAGVRLLYNVIDTRSPSNNLTPAQRADGYEGPVDLVGFTNTAGGTKSPLCSGQRSSTIRNFGFSPLPATANGTTNIAGSTCRLFTT